MPSRLIGHRLRVRLYDDRLECFLGATPVMTAPARALPAQRQARSCGGLSPRHPCPEAQAHGAAQPRLPRPALPTRRLCRRFEALLAALPDRKACQTMVGLLALAHERGCEADLAQALDQDLAAGRLPDLKALGPASRPIPPAFRKCACNWPR